jgi:hypothetical protein
MCRALAIVTPGRIRAPRIASQRCAALFGWDAPGAENETVPASRTATRELRAIDFIA